MYNLTVYYLFDIATSIIFIMYFNNILPFRFSNKKMLLIPFIAVLSYSFITDIFVSHISGLTELNMYLVHFLINYSALILVVAFFKRFRVGLLYALVLEIIMLLADSIIYISSNILSEQSITILSNFLSGKIASTILWILGAMICAPKFKLIAESDSTYGSFWLILSMIPMCSALLIFHITTTYLRLHTNAFLALFSMLSISLINIITIVLNAKIVDYYSTKHANDALKTHIDALVEKDKTLADRFHSTQQVQHDLKNKLLPLSYAIEYGDYENIQAGIKNIIGEIDCKALISNTGLGYVDDMINYKLTIAKDKEIDVQFDSDIEYIADLNYLDISTTIGIALDNAIEACACLDKTKRLINVSLTCKKGAIIISIGNPMASPLVHNEKGKLLSKKRAYKSRGLGVDGMQFIIDRNRGFLHYEEEGGIFKLKLIFFDSEN